MTAGFSWSFKVVSSLPERICLEWKVEGSTGVLPMSNSWVTIQGWGRWIIKCVCVSSFFLCESAINDICIYVALTQSVYVCWLILFASEESWLFWQAACWRCQAQIVHIVLCPSMHSHIQLYVTHTPTYIDKPTWRLKNNKAWNFLHISPL